MTDLLGLEERLSPQFAEIKEPVMIVEYEGREATMLLDKMPRPGYAWIKYEVGQEEIEVVIRQCKIKRLIDAFTGN